jgi:hypothetical protein
MTITPYPHRPRDLIYGEWLEKEEWVGVLNLSTRWQMKEVRLTKERDSLSAHGHDTDQGVGHQEFVDAVFELCGESGPCSRS